MDEVDQLILHYTNNLDTRYESKKCHETVIEYALL